MIARVKRCAVPSFSNLNGGWRPRALASGYPPGTVFIFKTYRLHIPHNEFRQQQIDH